METKCEQCTKKDVCKFVEKMEIFAKSMYDKYEYDEWNTTFKILKDTNINCKYFSKKE